MEHRIRRNVLESQIVDTCGAAVDSTFASVEVAVQPNYAIGVFTDQRLMITPLKRFQQVRPNFDHVDEERKKRTIQTKQQIQADKQAQNSLTRVNANVQKQQKNVVDVEWRQLQIFDQENAQTAKEFAKLSKFRKLEKSDEAHEPMQQLDR